jgi:hypothetical protein
MWQIQGLINDKFAVLRRDFARQRVLHWKLIYFAIAADYKVQQFLFGVLQRFHIE